MKVPGRFCAADALSTRLETADALKETLAVLTERIGGNPDLACVFFTPHHSKKADFIAEEMRGFLGADALVGCSASGVIGGGREVENGAGLAVWAARVPGARAQAFYLSFERTDEGGMVRGWPDLDENASAVLLADPHSFPLDPFLTSLRNLHRPPHIIGGVASGGINEGSNRLVVDDKVMRDGAVGFVLDGPAALEPLVSQGCRPVGEPLEITRSDRNRIYELAGIPAYNTLSSLLQDLDEDEAKRFRMAPQVGLRSVRSTGDIGSDGYLIRGVVGVEEDSGAVLVNDLVHDGLMLQFHTRDGMTAHHDLEGTLSIANGLFPEAAGALLFTCTGRGRRLFESPDHDIGLARKYFPDLAVAGMFANGEIGSVCGMPYIHGFTASFGLLVQREP